MSRSPVALRPAPRKTGALALCLATAGGLGACHDAAPDSAPPTDTAAQAIFNGTRDPQTVALNAGQILSLGWLFYAGDPGQPFCTATLIAPQTIATAQHCMQGVRPNDLGFGVGQLPSNPDATFDIANIWVHPQLDMAILTLAENAVDRVPDLIPIPANTVDPSPLENTEVQVGGYGENNLRQEGRFFATVLLAQVNQQEVVVDGRGREGLCFGDSGGPVIGVLGNGPVVMGVESYGDGSCVDVDHLTRLDLAVDEIAAIVGGDQPAPPPDNCNGIDYLGECQGGTAVWCENGQLQSIDCAAEGYACGYVDDQIGWYCVEGDPQGGGGGAGGAGGGGGGGDCGAVTATPVCQGDTIVACNGGTLVSEPCAADEHCVDGAAGAHCAPDSVGPGGPDAGAPAPDAALPDPGTGGTNGGGAGGAPSGSGGTQGGVGGIVVTPGLEDGGMAETQTGSDGGPNEVKGGNGGGSCAVAAPGQSSPGALLSLFGALTAFGGLRRRRTAPRSAG